MSAVLRVRYRGGAEFLRHYQPAMPAGGVFFATRAMLEPGQRVMLSVRFGELPGEQWLRGEVVWRRTGKHRTHLRAGVGIAFLPTERKRVDFVLAAARPPAPTAEDTSHLCQHYYGPEAGYCFSTAGNHCPAHRTPVPAVAGGAAHDAWQRDQRALKAAVLFVELYDTCDIDFEFDLPVFNERFKALRDALAARIPAPTADGDEK